MTKIPSSSHWQGDGQGGAAGPCLSWTRPYPHTPGGADPQTPPATQRSRSLGSSMSGASPVCLQLHTCRGRSLTCRSLSQSSSLMCHQVQGVSASDSPDFFLCNLSTLSTCPCHRLCVFIFSLSASTTSSPGVNFAAASLPSICPLSHTHQHTHSFSLSLSLSLLVYISCSLCLSLLTYCRRSS